MAGKVQETTNLQDKESTGRDEMTSVLQEVMDIPCHYSKAHATPI